MRKVQVLLFSLFVTLIGSVAYGQSSMRDCVDKKMYDLGLNTFQNRWNASTIVGKIQMNMIRQCESELFQVTPTVQPTKAIVPPQPETSETNVIEI